MRKQVILVDTPEKKLTVELDLARTKIILEESQKLMTELQNSLWIGDSKERKTKQNKITQKNEYLKKELGLISQRIENNYEV